MALDLNSKVINICDLYKVYYSEKIFKIDILTKNTNLLYEPELLNLILTEIKLRSLILEEINIHAFCIMPEHITMVLNIKEEGVSLSSWVKKFKAYITKNSINKKLWQPKFKYEEIESALLTYKCQEVVKQPEVLGLVDDWSEYGLSFKA